MEKLSRIFLILLVTVLSNSISLASTYFVNASTGNNTNNGTSSGTAFKTITKALSVAADGDVINIAAGTYNKTLGETFPLNMVSGVLLSGTSGAAATIIDASGDSNRVFLCTSNSSTTIIQGFTITGGFVMNYSTPGATSKGGGIYIDGGSPVIQNNIITKDTAHGYDFYMAGASALDGGTCYGGGIYVLGTPTIRNNVISYNIAQGGGGKDYRGGFSGNGSAGGNADGGGIHAAFGGASTIINNTFYGNKAVGGLGGSSNSLAAGNGGNAVSGGIDAGSSAIVKNNIFSNNSAIGGTVGGGTGGSNGTAIDGALTSYTAVNLTYNLFYNNTAVTNSDGGTLGSNTVIGSDPLFVSTTNFHFSSISSPAYHAGNGTSAPSTDLEGSSRSGTTPSMGAYEGTVPLPVELTTFTANHKGGLVELQWRTATEVNNYGFEIERKINPLSPPLQGGDARGGWIKLGFVEGNGTTNSPISYSYIDNSANGKVMYRLKQIDRDGKFEYSPSVEIIVSNAPKDFALLQNYPNPFNPATMIGYQLPKNSHVSLKVYDVIGREVATLVNEVKEAGSYSATFDATMFSSGIYFTKLQSGDKMQMKKMILLK